MPETGEIVRYAAVAALICLLAVLRPNWLVRALRSVPGRLLLGFAAFGFLLGLEAEGSVWKVTTALAALGLYAGLVLLLERRYPEEILARAGFRDAALGLALGMLLSAVTLALASGEAGFGPLESSRVVPFLAAAVLAGVVEELLFRGLLLRLLEEWLGTLIALPLSAAAFAWLHSQGLRTDTFFAGLALGACFIATRRLWLPIAGHITHNFVLDLWSNGSSKMIEGLAYRTTLSTALSIGAFLAVTGILLLLAFRRNRIVFPRWLRARASTRVACLIAGAVALGLGGLAHPAGLWAQERVDFTTQDGGRVYGDLYGKGDRGVVLAHGARFNKESWAPQAQALAAAGFRVLAIDFRGYGQSRGPGQADPMSAPLHWDVLAAVRYLRKAGAKSVAVVGGSLGGMAAGQAVIEAKPGEIERVVLLAAPVDGPPEKLTGRKLFILTRDDVSGSGPRLPRIREQYERAPQPKELVLLDGSAHAQLIFQTDQGERLMREILRFLSAP